MNRRLSQNLRELVKNHLRTTVGRGPRENSEGALVFGRVARKDALALKRKDPKSRVRAGDPIILTAEEAAKIEAEKVEKATAAIDDLTSTVAAIAAEEIGHFLSTDAVSKVLEKEPEVAKAKKPAKPAKPQTAAKRASAK